MLESVVLAYVGDEKRGVLPEWRETPLQQLCHEVREGGEATTTDLYLDAAESWLDVRAVALACGGVERGSGERRVRAKSLATSECCQSGRPNGCK